LASIARDAIELFGGPDLTRLRSCGRAGCTRLFVDDSRGANRVWCGMRECGNKVNAAAYRRRQR
jgi:predicted RNA-binding Zn ribbon-like protein